MIIKGDWETRRIDEWISLPDNNWTKWTPESVPFGLGHFGITAPNTVQILTQQQGNRVFFRALDDTNTILQSGVQPL